MTGHGIKIGGGIETKKGEWRCGVCKFKNVPVSDNEEEIERCNMCKEPKQVMKEPKVAQIGEGIGATNKIPKVVPPKGRMHEENK